MLQQMTLHSPFPFFFSAASSSLGLLQGLGDGLSLKNSILAKMVGVESDSHVSTITHFCSIVPNIKALYF